MPKRGAVTDEYLQLYKELWTKKFPEFQGEHFQISGAGFEPKPVQKPHIPIWIGGHTGPAIRRAAQLADGWMPIGLRPPAILEPEEMAAKIARLRRLTVRAGRPEDAVDVTFSTNVAFDDSPTQARRMMTGRPGANRFRPAPVPGPGRQEFHHRVRRRRGGGPSGQHGEVLPASHALDSLVPAGLGTVSGLTWPVGGGYQDSGLSGVSNETVSKVPGATAFTMPILGAQRHPRLSRRSGNPEPFTSIAWVRIRKTPRLSAKQEGPT